MSDIFISLVPQPINTTEVIALADKVINWLYQQNIIKNTKTDCVLGSNEGYPPGDGFKKIIDGDDYGLLDLYTNGLEVKIAREVFHNGGHGVDSISCPNCNCNIISTDWGEIIDEWYNETGKDKIVCLDCKTTASITEYKFVPAWAFGNLGFTFWNWPPFKEGFVKDLETLTAKSITIVYGRL